MIFVNQLHNIDLAYHWVFCNIKRMQHCHKPLLLCNSSKHFSLMISKTYYIFFLVPIISSYSFTMITASSSFSTLSACSFSSSVSKFSLSINELGNIVLICSLLSSLFPTVLPALLFCCYKQKTVRRQLLL